MLSWLAWIGLAWLSTAGLAYGQEGRYKRSTMGHYDTIVVGLGSAGVTAASTLASAGQKVLALEAQGHIGGRVKTVPFGDGVIEEGAEWIHGAVNSSVYTAAIKNNISLIFQDPHVRVFKSNGNITDDTLVAELLGFCLDDNVRTPTADYPGKLGEIITNRLMDYLEEKQHQILNDMEFIKGILDIANLLICIKDGTSDWNDVVIDGKYMDLDGHQYVSWHKYGYKTLFEIMLKTYNNGPGFPNLDIKLNTPVAQIVWPTEASGDVRVVCDGGDTYTARHVIVTVSLGVLKARHETLFNPALPQDKITAIESLSMGLTDKIVFNFPHAWWPEKGWFYGFAWISEDKAQVAKEDSWMTKILAVSNPLGCSTALTFWTTGDTAKMVENLPEEVVKRNCMKVLRKFMGKTYDIPEPIEMLRSTWQSNPYTLGAFSTDSSIDDDSSRERLAASLYDASGTPRVLFAGEATDKFQYSVVHGACDTGYRAANKLLNL